MGPRLLFIPGGVIAPDILSNKTIIFISPDDTFIGQVEKSLSRGKGKVFQYSGERLEPARQPWPWVRFTLRPLSKALEYWIESYQLHDIFY